jgi:CDP-diacylglycerol--glycerol-3-phosphate 3-phosphatidyltransferase
MNLPNILAFARILIAPVIFMLLVDRDLFVGIHHSWLDYFAGLLFVIAGITDFLDGYIARKWNQITKLGSILDPLADKMLTLAGFLGLMILGRADEWAIFLILTREFFITGLRVVAVSEGRDVSATFAGKVKTVVQLIAIGFLIMNWSFGDLLLWLSVVLTIYSGYEYVREYWRSTKC